MCVGDFTDGGETAFTGSGNSTVSGTINVPGSAAGATRMRVSLAQRCLQRGDAGRALEILGAEPAADTSDALGLWFDTRADLSLVPTEMARQRALDYDMPPENLRVVGQPIPERCAVPSGTKSELRENGMNPAIPSLHPN